jgi:4-hydroxy-3-polyprenylbenzoate decarboxylase
MKTMDKRIIIGITGASGVIYGIEMLRGLKDLDYETYLILTDAAAINIEIETDYTVDQVRSLASFVLDDRDLAAPVSSGSFRTLGMIVAPCSMKSLSAIVNSYGANLLVRAADVCLKERRKLALLVRETPLHQGHLRLMMTAAENGAFILPPIPAFYHRPTTIMDIVHQTIGKCFDHFQIEHQLFRRWSGHKVNP